MPKLWDESMRTNMRKKIRIRDSLRKYYNIDIELVDE